MISSSDTETDIDLELVRCAKTGCVDSFEILVRKYQKPLRHYLANRIFDRATMDDIAQDVFMVAIGKISNLQNDRSFGGWLLSIARNKCVDHIRSQARHQRTSNEQLDYLVAVESADRTGHEDISSLENKVNLLRRCIGKLSPHANKLIQDFYFKNKTAVEISSDSNRKQSSIRMALLRIRSTLAKCIQESEGEK